jgi:hypothetical protein
VLRHVKKKSRSRGAARAVRALSARRSEGRELALWFVLRGWAPDAQVLANYYVIGFYLGCSIVALLLINS